MTPQEMQDLSKEFARQLKIVFGNNGPGNSNNNNSNRRSGANAIRDSEGESNYRKNFKRDLMGLSKSLRTIIDDTDKVMRDFNISQRGIVNLQNKIYSDILNNEKLSNKAQERLRKRLNEWARQQSNLTSQLMDAAGNYKDINKYLEETADKLEDYNDVLDENMSTTIRGITSLKKMAKAIDKLGKSAEYNAQMQAVIARDAQGNFVYSLTEQRKQRRAIIESLAESIDQENEARKKSRNAILGQAADMGRTAGFMAELNSIGEKALQAGGFGFLLTKGTILLAAFVNVLAQAGEYYNRILTSLSIGETGLGAPITLTIEAGKIGTSFEKLTALINENYRTVASLGGSKSFVDAIKQYRGALNSLGEFGEAANKGVVGMLEGARASGIDLKNRSLLNKSMAAQQDAYKYLRTAINETGEAFAKNNLTVLQSAEYETRSALLSKKRRALLIGEIAQSRKELAKSGILNSEIQLSILKQTQALLNKPIAERFKDIGAIQRAGGQLGMSAEADEISKILLKGNSRTDADQARLGNLVMSLTKKNNANKAKAQSMGDAGRGLENVADQIGADLAKILPDANKANIEKENPNNKRDIAAEEAKRRVSEGEQITINAISTIASWLGDKIVKAITTLGVVIAGLLIFNAVKGGAVGIMGFIAGLFAGIKSGILRGIAFVFGTGGAGSLIKTIVSGIAKLFAPAVLAIGIARGFMDLMDDPRYSSDSSVERLTNAVSSVLAGIVSTAISAITLGMVNVDMKDMKKNIEQKFLPALGGIFTLILTPIGGLLIALGKAIGGGFKALFNIIIDAIDAEWMPDTIRKRLQSYKFNNPWATDWGDGSGNTNPLEYMQNIGSQTAETYDSLYNMATGWPTNQSTINKPSTGSPTNQSTINKPSPVLIPKNKIMSTTELQESVFDPANNIMNKKDPIEGQINALNAILTVLKAQYALEQQVAQKSGTLFGSIGKDTEPAIG